MADPPLPTDRFFARIRSVDLECPRCGTVYVCTPRSGPYSAKTGLFRCRCCSLTLALGVLAYRVTSAHVQRAPLDWVPTPEQALALRSALAGGHADRGPRRTWSDPHNVALKEPCPCTLHGRGLVTNPNCPIHALATRGRAGSDPP